MPNPSTDLANLLFTELLADANISIPNLDLNDPIYDLPFDNTSTIFDPVEKLTNEDLTTGEIGGTGTFDALMKGFSAHLKKEYELGRITGAEYTKAYITLTQSAMSNAVQYLTTKDQAFWQAVQAQIGAITANVQLAQAKVEYAALYVRALTEKANYALSKLNLSVTNIEYASGKYNLDNILPENYALLQEKVETQRAETQDDRTDGAQVTGSVGKQKELYQQQIVSYKRDAETKVARIYTDTWTAMKTVNSAITPPTAFNNSNLDSILGILESNTFN